MRPSALDLLLHGYATEFIPPDAVTLPGGDVPQLDEVVLTREEQAVGTRSVIHERIEDMTQRVEAMLVELAPVALLQPTVADPYTGALVTLPTPDEYQQQVCGSVTFEQAHALELFESHHLSEAGNLGVFLLLGVLDVAADLGLFAKSPLLDALDEESTPAQATVLDYITYKSSQMEMAVSSLERAIYVPDAPDVTHPATLQDLLGGNDPTVLALQDITELQRQRTDLQKMRSMLRILYLGMNIDILNNLDSVRSWAAARIHQTVDHLQAKVVAEVYERVLHPAVQQALDWDTASKSSDIERLCPLLTQIRAAATEGLFTRMAHVKQVLVDLAKTDRARSQTYQDHAACLAKKAQAKKFMDLLGKAIKAIDVVIDGNPYGIAEAEARKVLQRTKMPKLIPGGTPPPGGF